MDQIAKNSTYEMIKSQTPRQIGKDLTYLNISFVIIWKAYVFRDKYEIMKLKKRTTMARVLI